jgi:hypothetical protein
MSVIVLLDAGPLGMITNPKSSPENEACKTWLAGLAYKGVEVMIPEIADYEQMSSTNAAPANSAASAGRMSRTASACMPVSVN